MKNRSVRLTALILLLVLALTACAAPATEAQTEAPAEPPVLSLRAGDTSFIPDHVLRKQSVKLLLLGNSFTKNICTHLYTVLSELGYTDITLGRMAIDAAKLPDHAKNFRTGKAAYEFLVNTDGEWRSQGMKDAEFCTAFAPWDFITIQQPSPWSDTAECSAALAELVSFFAEKAPAAKLAGYMTWTRSEAGIRSKKELAERYPSQEALFEDTVRILDIYKAHPEIVTVIPVGTALQNVRTAMGDRIDRDGYHLAEGFPMYIASMAMAGWLTGQPVDGLTGACVAPNPEKLDQLWLDSGILGSNAAFEAPTVITPITVDR